MNFTHKVPGKQPEVFITSGLRMEGSKLVPIESKSLGQDTLVSWQVNVENIFEIISMRVKSENFTIFPPISRRFRTRVTIIKEKM